MAALIPVVRPVFTGNEVYIDIFACDSDGVLTSQDPIIECCFTHGVSVSGQCQTEFRPGTANAKRELIQQGTWDEYRATLRSMYVSKEHDLNLAAIFHRDKHLTIRIRCIPDDPIKPEEEHLMTACKAISFTIESDDNKIVEVNAELTGNNFT